MEYQQIHLEKLIEKVKGKSGAMDFSMKGFEDMAIALERAHLTFDATYLKRLYDGKWTTIRPSKVDDLAKYLGHLNYNSFVKSLDVDPVLESMIGNYYSYLRMNHEEAKLLRSPVRIFMKDGQVSYHQKGGRLTFEGTIKKHEGCLFVLMQSPDGTKSFYHVYRIGARTNPQVLQGIFSGVSTDFSPIGGRAVLFRSKEEFDSLETGILDVDSLRNSKLKDERALGQYFEHRVENNLSIKPPSTYDVPDLTNR